MILAFAVITFVAFISLGKVIALRREMRKYKDFIANEFNRVWQAVREK